MPLLVRVLVALVIVKHELSRTLWMPSEIRVECYEQIRISMGSRARIIRGVSTVERQPDLPF